MRTKLAAMALCLGLAATATANDSSLMRSDLADWQTRGASVEASRAVRSSTQCAPCEVKPEPTCRVCNVADKCEPDAYLLSSMKKNACITIGGEVDIPLFYTNRDAMGNGDVDYDNTYFSGEAALYIDAIATADSKLRIKLDLEDGFNGADNDDLLEEVYFQWNNVACTGLGIAIGKKEVSFGQDKTIGYFTGLAHGRAELFRGPADKYTGNFFNETAATAGNSLGLPGEVDNQFQVEVSYAFADIAKVSATLFQNSANEGWTRSVGNAGFVDMAGDKSRDMGFRSWALKGEVTPFEGLNINASFINLYDRIGKYYQGAKSSSQALSIGASYKFNSIDLELFGEYLHGWNWNHVDDRDTDTISLGAIWGVTDRIDLGLMGEWAQIEGDAWNLGKDQDYWSIYATVYYNMTANMRIGLEFLWQRYEDDNLFNGDDRDAFAIGMVTSWKF